MPITHGKRVNRWTRLLHNNNNKNMGNTQKERHTQNNQIKILEIARPTWTVV
jgi:hypothetical protein